MKQNNLKSGDGQFTFNVFPWHQPFWFSFFCKSKDIEVNMSKLEKDKSVDISEEEQDESALYLRSPSLYEIVLIDGQEVQQKKEK